MKKVLWNKEWTFTSDICDTPVKINLPHDAMQTEKRVPGMVNGPASGCYPGGKYTYVKRLEVSAEDLRKTTLLEFEGIYMKSSVYLNGSLVGGHIYGYTDFYVDLTGKLQAGSNEIKVIADNTQCPNSRWYSGSGIYRDVWLHTAEEAYLKPGGIRVTTLSIAPAKIRVQTEAVNQADAQVQIQVLKDGEIVAQGAGNDVTLDIPSAKLWSAETPELYQIHAELVKADAVIDSDCADFGIRKLAWDSKKGFQVNGQTVKLRGGCVHHDHTFIGTAEFDVACERKVRIMKEAGFNAVRIAHHPASKAMLRACDKLGMYMMNESFDTWLGLKSPYDYAMYFTQEWKNDLGAMIRLSYNHPCVVMYCIGNEILLKDYEKAGQVTKEMTDFCRSLDTTRPVTNALNPLMVIMGDDKDPTKDRDVVVDPRKEGANSGLAGSQLANVLITLMPLLRKLFGNEKAMIKRNGCMAPLDIVGYNYAEYLYESQHKDYPERLLCGTETFPAQIGKTWTMTEQMSWVVGDFLWTAWDYLGEAGVGAVSYSKQESFSQPYPCIAAGCANIDLTGQINCQGYYTAVVYGQYQKPFIAVHPVDHAGEKVFVGQWRFTDAVRSWTWHGLEGKKPLVDVYARAAQVELFQDGKSLGKKPVKNYMATYEVEYQSGQLKAISYDAKGNVLGEDILCTGGTDMQLTVRPEKDALIAGGSDLLYIPIEITDGNGTCHIRKDRKVTVKVEGAAELMAIGSAALTQDSLSPYTGDSIETYQGRALAILRSTDAVGPVRIQVSANGLETVSLNLQAV